jgi:hypothetical protein
MEINKTILFKLYIDYDKIMVVSGYDFISNKYILKKYSSKNQNYIWNDYVELTDSIMKKLISSDEAIDNINEKIKKIEEIISLYEKFDSNCKMYEAKNTVRRLVDTKKYILVLQNTYTKFNGKDKQMYERELKKALKGERRILKVLYGKLSEKDYHIFLDYIEKYPDFNIFDFKNKIKRYKNLLAQLEEISKIKI